MPVVFVVVFHLEFAQRLDSIFMSTLGVSECVPLQEVREKRKVRSPGQVWGMSQSLYLLENHHKDNMGNWGKLKQKKEKLCK